MGLGSKLFSRVQDLITFVKLVVLNWPQKPYVEKARASEEAPHLTVETIRVVVVK
jgi:hypothetical protein